MEHYQPGDIANGHILTSQGQWVPIPQNCVAPTQNTGRGLSIAGLALGILSLAAALLTLGYGVGIALMLGGVGLPLSIVGYRQASRADGDGIVGAVGIALNASGVAAAVIVYGIILVRYTQSI